MRSAIENETVWLMPEGRIDSTNAADFERETGEALAAHPGMKFGLDADKLEYISSAGLRVLMKLRKRAKAALPVVNVSAEVYEIFEVTGFTELLDVKKRMRRLSVEGLKELGSGANGRVYRLTRDEMIKVFRPGITLDEIETEREASRKAFLLGVPCAIAFDTVRVGDCYGTVYEALNAATLSERVREKPERLEALAEASGKLLRELHATEVPEGMMLPADRILHSTLDKVAGDFTPDELEKLRALYRAIPAMSRFVHNDYHAKNVMETGDGSLMLIDLGDAGAGSPLIDLIHCHMIYNFMGSGQKAQAEDAMSFIGLTYGELRRFWRVFSETYFGSAARARAMDEALRPYGQLMYLTVAMAYPRLPAQYHAVYADKVRGEVLSRYDELLGSLAGAWED